MSGFAEPERSNAAPNPERPGRSRALIITTGVLIFGFLALTGISSFWTERLWFDSLGYGEVFSRLVSVRVGLFLVFGLLMALAVGLSMALAFRLRPIFRPASPEQTSLDRYRMAVTPIRRWLLIAVALVMGAFAGTSAAGEWRTFLLWRNGVSFGRTDPYFHRDIGWYIFDLPWWHYLVDFTMTTVVVSLMAAAVVHYLYGGIRLQGTTDRLSGPAAAQLSIMLGVLVLAKAVDYWLDRFDILHGSGRLIDGMTYTDDHAVLPAKNILLGIAVICAMLFFLNVWRRTWLLPSVGLVLFVLSAILLGMIWPGIVQRFQVSPSEGDQEASYIARNIEATRAAYDLEDIKIEDYDDTSSKETPAQIEAATQSVPLVDPQLVRQTFEANQQLTGFYTLPQVLDVDRYPVNGTERALVLGARELNQDGLDSQYKNWQNLRTVYTHGYGIVGAYANQRSETEETLVGNDDRMWAEGELPPRGVLTDEGYEPRIYFGENSEGYSIVGAAPGGKAVEYDRPASKENPQQGTTTTYDGKAGVKIGGLWRQLLYSVKFGDANIVLSARVNEDSKIIYDRDPAKMVEKVAPWLSVDGDPYPAVVDGKVVWVLDGYTTTDRYPMSEKDSFQTMTDDALAQTTGFQALPTDEINYMRNSVKATVDAYDGTVTLYQWDEEDPLLKAWMGAFPGTVQPRSDISPDLLAHLRYPEDLFKVQRYQYARYHVTDASQFYEGNDRWDVPSDPYHGGLKVPPYRLFAQMPKQKQSEWSMTSTYVPYGRNNLAGYMAVNSDATSGDYGKMTVLRSPGQNIKGPGQVAASFSPAENVRNALFKYTGGTEPVYGNLLTVPVDGRLLWVQPVYVVREGSASFPILNLVIASFGGDQVGIGASLPLALTDLLEAGKGTPSTGPPTTNGGDHNNTTVPSEVETLLEEADTAFKAADQALKNGNYERWGAQMQLGREKLADAIEAAKNAEKPGTKPGTNQSHSASPSAPPSQSPSG